MGGSKEVGGGSDKLEGRRFCWVSSKRAQRMQEGMSRGQQRHVKRGEQNVKKERSSREQERRGAIVKAGEEQEQEHACTGEERGGGGAGG